MALICSLQTKALLPRLIQKNFHKNKKVTSQFKEVTFLLGFKLYLRGFIHDVLVQKLPDFVVSFDLVFFFS